ncbi:hypothetical protein CDAR_378831 [Caerostris darwini]|uniref:Uncharacterized protein n=1 Tax=Caerostris darwini TaxID=1538125 RepID=A0AAV4TZ62_9ARAC|nr:hypothetical protein CDAR_378831 [Caerostris darwini]
MRVKHVEVHIGERLIMCQFTVAGHAHYPAWALSGTNSPGFWKRESYGKGFSKCLLTDYFSYGQTYDSSPSKHTKATKMLLRDRNLAPFVLLKRLMGTSSPLALNKWPQSHPIVSQDTFGRVT